MSDLAKVRQVQAFLEGNFPLAVSMGVRVEACGGEGLVLVAPLLPNRNHLGTAFGGSLAAVAMLAGYGYLWVALGDPAAHLVVGQAEVVYRRPVRGEIRAVCRGGMGGVGEGEMEVFREEVGRGGKGRIRVGVTIEEEGEVAVRFAGTFVGVK